MTTKRLSIGHLPEKFEQELRNLSANARVSTHGQLDPNGDIQQVIAPFTGDSIGWVAKGTEEDVAQTFERARRAQRDWRHVPFAARKRIFSRFHDDVLKNRELFADMIQLETGKNRASAMDEVLDVANNARYYANNAEKFMSDRSRKTSLPILIKSTEQRDPLGVVGQISPWNYPLALGIGDAIPALLAGNAVVAKPDSNTPFTSLLAFKLLFDAGLPRDLAQVVTGTGRVVGGAIAEHCDFLMFTGSTATGKILGQTAGRRLIGFSAELGGKNPLIIANDADMDYTVRDVIDGYFSNSGQLCVSIERIYVERGSYDEFVSRVVDAVRAMSIGPGLDPTVDMGSLASEDQLNTVTEFVEDARQKGATILTGGKARPDLGPYFYEPTLLVDVPENARLRREEVFGPVVYIEPVSDLQEAVEKANDTAYGLSASVFAASETAWRIGSQIDSGAVSLNDGYTTAWSSIGNPMGGRKESGVSHRHGAEGLLKYTASRNISEQRFMSFRGPAWMNRKTYSKLMANGLLLGKKFKILP